MSDNEDLVRGTDRRDLKRAKKLEQHQDKTAQRQARNKAMRLQKAGAKVRGRKLK